MDMIGVRELRQHASVYLRRVRSGETLCITDRGSAVAFLAGTPEGLRLAASELLQALVASGAYPDLDAALAAGVESVTADLRRHIVDQAVVEGYTRVPQEPDPWVAEASTQALGDLGRW